MHVSAKAVNLVSKLFRKSRPSSSCFSLQQPTEPAGDRSNLCHISNFTFQFANPDFTQPISEVVDEVIQNCPIDVRRPLYKVSFYSKIVIQGHTLKKLYFLSIVKY